MLNIEDALELGRRHALDQEVREHAGVVHEHVEAAESRDRGFDQTLDVLLHRNVCLDRGDGPPEGRKPLARGGEPVPAAVCEHHRRACLCKPARAGEAEALRRAGDERHLAVQLEQRRERRRSVHARTL
jgi:hypothetical protein